MNISSLLEGNNPNQSIMAKPLVKKHYKNVGKHCTYCLFNKTEHCDKINQ